MSLEEIGNLTPYQVKNILFRPEHRHDPLFDAYIKEKETFWKVNKEWRGKTETEVAQLWRERIASDQQLQMLSGLQPTLQSPGPG